MNTGSRIVYMRRSERARKPSRKRKIAFIFFAFLLCALAGSSVYLLRHPALQVTDISVVGLRRVLPAEIELKIREELSGNFFYVIPRSSIVLFSASALEGTLKSAMPRLASLHITREFPSKISVEAREREFWAVFCAGEGGECGYMDRTGFVYESAPQSSGSLILSVRKDTGSVGIPSQAIEPALAEQFADAVRVLKEEIGEDGESFFIFSELRDEFRIKVRSGYTLYIKRDDEFKNTIAILKTFLEKEAGENRKDLDYIDLRFGNKIFYKLK
ncbi:MAG: hypothetical protein A2847_00600 [Candidatus Sungbacteria bacterium RIFCSPHIGHO2_01_FULL_50_25]|uniref:POTRA domain-containing protein n=1 Tax=Candidatus Sungbacteria bacterium RIFCSPHIGHO2_01_FULL_50_25 TaxID=1802265 RepID=A0A1G2K6T5_9BACT|nr:MAG: hypothetical protein A2847_00600 [Candidatus Sungbacteria bacterium RIFCSPHIGHO2_01_FULL_50_25]